MPAPPESIERRALAMIAAKLATLWSYTPIAPFGLTFDAAQPAHMIRWTGGAAFTKPEVASPQTGTGYVEVAVTGFEPRQTSSGYLRPGDGKLVAGFDKDRLVTYRLHAPAGRLDVESHLSDLAGVLTGDLGFAGYQESATVGGVKFCLYNRPGSAPYAQASVPLKDSQTKLMLVQHPLRLELAAQP